MQMLLLCTTTCRRCSQPTDYAADKTFSARRGRQFADWPKVQSLAAWQSPLLATPALAKDELMTDLMTRDLGAAVANLPLAIAPAAQDDYLPLLVANDQSVWDAMIQCRMQVAKATAGLGGLTANMIADACDVRTVAHAASHGHLHDYVALASSLPAAVAATDADTVVELANNDGANLRHVLSPFCA